MIRSFRIVIFIALLVLFSGVSKQASSQTTIQYYSTFAKNNQVPTECSNTGLIVQKIIDKYDHPAQWRWIVACDEPAWNRVEQHLGRQYRSDGLYLAFTDPDNRVTYVRGNMVLHPFSSSDLMQPDHTIRHELGHILQHEASCDMAERYAAQLLARRKAEEALLRNSWQ
jgi:hypothetical protein